ncbi:MAG TPA: hypothetical protein VLL52_01065 [Anaerolineae bacterium]|nr:hypothetical protein [Anaerolineae bacterium]
MMVGCTLRHYGCGTGIGGGVEGGEAEVVVWWLGDDGGRGIVREKGWRWGVRLGAQCRVITVVGRIELCSK